MKDLKAIMLGFASCMLLAAGFARAGERLDPLSAQTKNKVQPATVESEPAAIPCFENGGSWEEGDDGSWSGDDDGRISPTTPIAPK